MQVTAISDCFYGGIRRRKGSRFDWAGDVLPSCLVPVGEVKQEAEQEKEPDTFSAINKKQKPTKVDKALAGE